jgi:hypothetical protein
MSADHLDDLVSECRRDEGVQQARRRKAVADSAALKKQDAALSALYNCGKDQLDRELGRPATNEKYVEVLARRVVEAGAALAVDSRARLEAVRRSLIGAELAACELLLCGDVEVVLQRLHRISESDTLLNAVAAWLRFRVEDVLHGDDVVDEDEDDLVVDGCDSDLQDDVVEDDVEADDPQHIHPDGPEGGCLLWWKGTKNVVPRGNVYNLIAHMWRRDTATYKDVCGRDVLDSNLEPQSLRSLVNKVNEHLGRAGVPWKLSTDAKSRHIVKKAT